MDFGAWDHFRNEYELYIFTESWFKECMRVLKKDGWMYVFFGNTYIWILQKLIRKYGNYNIIHRTTFTWVKSNPAPSYRKYNWRSATEPAIVFSKGKCRIPNFLNQTYMKNFMITSCRSNYGVSGHPTEKPMQVFARFIEASSNEGELVADFFSGAGTTAVSCIELNRNFIGCENNKKWYDISMERIKNYKVDAGIEIGDSLLI